MVYNDYNGNWEIWHMNGGCKIVSNFNLCFSVIVIKSDDCVAVALTMCNGKSNRSYVIDYSDFISRNILKYMPFESRNPGTNKELIVETFYRSFKNCSNTTFLLFHQDLVGSYRRIADGDLFHLIQYIQP